MSLVKSFYERRLISPPEFVAGGVQYEVLMGSHAFGTAGEDSDNDVYGFCMPPLAELFAGSGCEASGSGGALQRFDHFKQLDVRVDDAYGRVRSHDFKIYSIVRFVQRCIENNPNTIEMLFAPEQNVLHLTPAGRLLRDHRRQFLHKGARYEFGGFARAQLDDLKAKRRQDGKRLEYIQRFGYDLKAAYHVVRLMNEAEQILAEGDLDLQRCSDQLLGIRAGKWKLAEVVDYFEHKDSRLEALYQSSELRTAADSNKIKELLIACLEMHFGSLSSGKSEIDEGASCHAISEIVLKS